MKSHSLLASTMAGSLVVEMAFALTNIPLDVRYLKWTDEGLVDPELKSKNPLSQVPTLTTPEGKVLTQSGAILLYLNDLNEQAKLIPGATTSERLHFFQWFMFINAAVYPTFTYGDFPSKWVPNEPRGAEALKKMTAQYREELWMILEKAAGSPWFLGDTFSALDLYIFTMNTWKPGKEWFFVHAPKVSAISQRLADDIRIQEVIQRQPQG